MLLNVRSAPVDRRTTSGQLVGGCPHDLASVCNDHGDETCINPCKGSDSGQTWEYRRGMIDGLMQEYNRNNRKSEQD